MNTKQTPEQAAMEAMRSLADGIYASMYGKAFYDDRTAARQTIIKAFQDRERLLEACEYLVKSCDTAPPVELMQYIADSCEKARTAINKAKGEA